jgi:hypothetical protein
MMPPTKAGVSKAGVKKPKGGQAKVFGITTTGQNKSADVLNSIGGRGADARPAWPAIFTLFTGYSEKRWQEEGPGWPPLAESTKETKARKNQDPRLMRVTGALQKSLVADRARGGIRKKSRYQLVYGSKVFYARFHQTGRGTPKRVLVEVTPELSRDITGALERFVVKGDLPDRLKPGGGSIF